MTANRQIYRQIYRPSALLVRPFEDGVSIRLNADAEALARAGALCAALHVPVDAAVALCFEALDARIEHDLERALEAVIALEAMTVPQHLTEWVDQLRHGCRWYEDELPRVLVSTRVAEALAQCPGPAVRLAGDSRRLAQVLAAEIASAEGGGRPLGDSLRASLALAN